MSARRQAALRRPGPTEGFALIEVLVALTLLAVGLVGVLTAVLAALDLQQDAALRYRAGLILEDKLAETSLASYRGETSRGASADGAFSWTIIGAPWQGVARDDAPKRQRSESADIADRLYEVRVDVSWQGDRGPCCLSATQIVGVHPGAEVLP